MKNQKGQALISLMFFVIISLFLITASLVMLTVSAESTEKVEGEEIATRVAETGADLALLKLLRDPTYSGETFTLTDGKAVVSVSSGTVTVSATSGTFVKTLVVGTNITNNVLGVTSWKEQY